MEQASPPEPSSRRRRRSVVAALSAGVAGAAPLLIGCGERPEPTGAPPSTRLPAQSKLPSTKPTEVARLARSAGCTLRAPRIEGRAHVEREVDYRSNPPTSGPHLPVPAPEGAYAEAPPPEALVHSLEHGRVILQFAPDAPEDVKTELRRIYDRDRYHVLLTPNRTGMPFEVAASSWGRYIGCPRAGPRAYEAISAFRGTFRDQGPERVP